MKKNLAAILVLISMLAISLIAVADEVPTPATPPDGVQIISADEVRDLLSNNNAQAYDMRKALNYGKGHLPGAISTPYKWTKKGELSQREGEFDMSVLPSDKSRTIVFHSDGPNGWKSYYAAKAAAQAGYKNVKWLREGFAVWSEKGYPVEN